MATATDAFAKLRAATLERCVTANAMWPAERGRGMNGFLTKPLEIARARTLGCTACACNNGGNKMASAMSTPVNGSSQRDHDDDPVRLRAPPLFERRQVLEEMRAALDSLDRNAPVSGGPQRRCKCEHPADSLRDSPMHSKPKRRMCALRGSYEAAPSPRSPRTLARASAAAGGEPPAA
jgi:hypothetical protein